MTGRERFVKVRLFGWLAAGVAWFVLVYPGVALPAGDLTPTEVQQLSRFAGATGFRDTPDWARAKIDSQVQQSYREARALFAGRGPDVARHFLTHTGVPPANGAYFFVLEAVADTDTALVLIRSLWAPFKGESGPSGKVEDHIGIRERENLEIGVAIESVLVNESVRSDPRTVGVLVEAITRLRAKPWPAYYTGMAVTLLGRCAGPEAAAALQKLAADPEAAIRSLAVQALGQVAGAVKAEQMETADRASTLATVMRTLRSDPNDRARLEAATALGNLGQADGAPPLREALATERHPEVVDAILLALQKVGAPLTDPRGCREVVGRTWEPAAARFPFACWRASASREALIEAATGGPAQLRALSLYSLVEHAAVRAPEPIVVLQPPMVAPPAPPGAKAITNVPLPLPPREKPPQVSFDEPTRERLLASAVETLSRPSAASPGRGGEISDSTARLLNDALWEISGRNMAVALAYADRISPPSGHYSTSGRYGTSSVLWNKDRTAYLDYRRPRQAMAAAILALLFGALLGWKKTRRAGALLVVAVLGWGIFSLYATEMRELPPPPLQFLTVAAIAFISAGISTAGAAALWHGRALGGMITRVGASIAVAAVLAFAVCGFTRGRVFPIGSEGWELIFDPVGSALIAAVVATGLTFLDGLLFRRFLGESG